MKITPLGVGGAFTDRFYHSNYLVECPGFRLLVDAGTTLRYSLPATGLSVRDIDAVAITHFHSDHVGGLEEMAQRCRYLYQYKPALFAMQDQLALFDSLFGLHGVKSSEYFAVAAGNSPLSFRDAGGLEYQLEYYSTLGLHAEVTSNYMIGVRRLGGDRARIIITGDLGPIERSELQRLASDPETAAIYQDCHTGSVPTPAHPSIEQLVKYYPPALRHKIYVTHYGDNIEEQREYIQSLGFKISEQGQSLRW